MLHRPSPFATAQGIGERRPMPTVLSPTVSDGTASVSAAPEGAASAQDGAWCALGSPLCCDGSDTDPLGLTPTPKALSALLQDLLRWRRMKPLRMLLSSRMS